MLRPLEPPALPSSSHSCPFQIKLLQGAANAYHIETLPRFKHWFQSVEVLDEKEAFDCSCEIEANVSASKLSQKSEPVRKPSGHFGLFKLEYFHPKLFVSSKMCLVDYVTW